MVLGEIRTGKAGGVDVRAKKEPCEREPLDELHFEQQAIIFYKELGSPPFLIATM